MDVFEDHPGTRIEIANYDVPVITENIVDGGLVMAYIDFNNEGASWWALPYTFEAAGNTGAFSINHIHQIGVFTLWFERERADPIVALFHGSPVKIITVPPGSAGRMEGVDMADLGAVERVLGLSAE